VVRLVEAAPVAGALRFELLSEGRYNAARTRQIARERVARKDAARRPRRGQTRKQ
jgi:ribonuclease R